MTKKELILKLVNRIDFPKRQAEEIVNAIFDTLKEGIKSGEGVTIAGFGTFTLVERKERKGRNPQTGDEITIPARKVVKFKPYKDLRRIA